MGGWGATQASGKKGIRLMVTGEEQVWRGPPAHHGSHLGKPVPDHLETARPPITVARTCYPDPFLVLGSTHALFSTQENNHTPLSKCNHPPLLPQRCPSTLVVCPSPPLVADCALRLAAAAARCQDLFRERAGGWAGEVRAHILEHRENPTAHLSNPDSPQPCIPA